ncbi:family 20 glycosylhydrolase [Mucilaginibacter sp. HC2]|uniref:beta-N-acetylhexosaminidase n=1 Tax=Mucilaginibacter inviolabilis TaxID=2714892 RepID=UPI0014076644|nr:family 20 glycosylhydrolase [Mucilaginibacter inviolabilis]NHA03764.1 family 20 glycosylhydrolase [Mucilaginibacter inviolabilis]
MKKALLIIFLLCVSIVANAQNSSLLPVPQQVSVGNGRFRLSSTFTVAVKADPGDSILYFAVNRAFQTLNRRTALYFGQQRITAKDASDTCSLIIRVKQKKEAIPGGDESYTLTVTPQNIYLEASATAGALHGLETLLQLVQHDKEGFFLPAVSIQDSPRFVWRGLMIDVARHFIPVDVIERNIDAMAAVKINVLHLHLSDDEGFRIESKLFPELQKKGSYDEYFTQAQIKQLIIYARQRGIIIVPEFDMPGHITGFLAGYPNLSSNPGQTYQPGPRFAFGDKQMGLMDIMKMINSYPTPSFDPSKESTYVFIDKFLGEMAVLFPSPYIHIGADENNGVSWRNNPDIVAFMQKNNLADTHALQAYFVKRVQQILTKHHKRTLGWEELLSKDLPKDVAVQVWTDGTKMNEAARLGHSVIVSKGFYLDLFMPAYTHYQNDLLVGNLPDSVASKILGGEAAQWAEAVDKDNIETQIWPRAAAVAERLWSPYTVNNVDDMYRRLFVISNQLDEIGVQHISNYERGLRRLTNGADMASLKTLTDVLTPLKGYKKLFAKMTSPKSMSYQTAPLTAISDIVFVDSEVKRQFRAAVKSYLDKSNDADATSITTQLKKWLDHRTAMEPMINKGLLDNNINENSKKLYAVAMIGLDAIKLLQNKEKPSADWLKQRLDALDQMKKVYGEVELAIIPEIRALVNQRMDAEPASYPIF